jgi:chromosomal replication initiation ATPase DnaA
MERLAQGHQDRFYDTVDQRVLGGERFLEAVARRTSQRRTMPPRAWQVSFGALLQAVARVYKVTPPVILAPRRQRTVLPARTLLVFLAREWGILSTQELGRRCHRDPSMISRLAAHRDMETEDQIRRVLQRSHLS